MISEGLKRNILNKNAQGSLKETKKLILETFDKKIEELFSDKEQINESLTHIEDEDERRWILQIDLTARSLGSTSSGEYEQGVYYNILRSKDAANDFSTFLEHCEVVDTYEMNVLNIDSSQDGYEKDKEYDFDKIKDDTLFAFEFFVYIDPSYVKYHGHEVEDDGYHYENIENGYLQELKRKIKVSSAGKKRIKIQCSKGFKWDANKNVCVKISGDELAKKRKSIKKSVLTKKAMGSTFRARVNRKTKKALKFRKSFGLK